MDLEQLTGRHARLQRDLATAYQAVPWNAAEIDRLADDLASTEREMAMRAGGRTGTISMHATATARTSPRFEP